MEDGPEPPTGGWTLREAAEAMFPQLLAAAEKQVQNGWMRGGGEPNPSERTELRRTFARMMEAGRYRATGLVKGREEAIDPLLWRAAEFGIGLRGEPRSDNAFWAGGKIFQGVRVHSAANTPGIERSASLEQLEWFLTGYAVHALDAGKKASREELRAVAKREKMGTAREVDEVHAGMPARLKNPDLSKGAKQETK